MRLIPRRTSDYCLTDPFKELENRLFGLSLCGPEVETSLFTGQGTPAIDIYDNKDNVVVKADLPGLKKEEIDISVQENLLTIKGEKKYESEVKKENFLRSERFYGSFQRTIVLPRGIDATKAQANFKDGVLELTFPKEENAKPKQIKVEVK